VGRRELSEFDITPFDLGEIVCGIKDGGEEDFDFRMYFQVVVDGDMKEGGEFYKVFWEVVDGLGKEDKRGLLLFITGINKLPSKGSEFLTVEMPFLPITVEDHEKMLKMVSERSGGGGGGGEGGGKRKGGFFSPQKSKVKKKKK